LKLVAVLIVGIIVGSAVTYAGLYASLTQPTQPTVTAPPGLTGTITIGELIELSGSFGDVGSRAKTAMDMALTDVNAWLASSNSSVRFQLAVEDTAGDPATALQKLQTLAAKGIQVFVGMGTSAQARNMLAYANSNHLVLISYSSTAPDLAIPNDYLFRLVPPDNVAGLPFARMIRTNFNYTHVIVLHRNDPFGNGLAAAFTAKYTQLGGTVDNVSYTPITTGSYDFTPQLTQIETLYKSGVATYGKVAVFAIGYDEIAAVLNQATSYPDLLKTLWFFNQGQLTSITQSAGTEAVAVKMLAALPAPTKSAKFQAFEQRFKAATGQEPGAFDALPAYDSVWVAALSILACGKNDGVCVQSIITTVSDNYFGVCGWMQLNTAGDRAATDYDIYEVANVNGTPTWVAVGAWGFSTDSVTFTSQP